MFKLPKDYNEARDEFRSLLKSVQQYYPAVSLEEFPVMGQELSIDLLYAPAPKGGSLLVLTSGLHGVEGYVGLAALKSFCQHILPDFSTEGWGLAMVHPLNPWGMASFRRVNENNVDLNRNFLGSWPQGKDLNPDYTLARAVMEPEAPLSKLKFSLAYAAALNQFGEDAMIRAATMGQYSSAQGVYYGGQGPETSNRIAQDLFRRFAQDSQRMLCIDIHTGYGPRGQLTLVNSPLESRSAQHFRSQLNWPHVVAADPENFYTILGDMGDWLYHLMKEEYPGKDFLATCYEYGTLGDAPVKALESMRRIINENSAWQDQGSQGRTMASFRELFAPEDPHWLAQAEKDFVTLTKSLLNYWQA